MSNDTSEDTPLPVSLAWILSTCGLPCRFTLRGVLRATAQHQWLVLLVEVGPQQTRHFAQELPAGAVLESMAVADLWRSLIVTSIKTVNAEGFW